MYRRDVAYRLGLIDVVVMVVISKYAYKYYVVSKRTALSVMQASRVRALVELRLRPVYQH